MFPSFFSYVWRSCIRHRKSLVQSSFQHSNVSNLFPCSRNFHWNFNSRSSSVTVTASVASECREGETSQKKEEIIRPRRALLYMPGSNAKMLKKAAIVGADTICMDLEVRINPIDSGFEKDDLTAILKGKVLPDGLVIPKVRSPNDLAFVEEQIHTLVGNKGAGLILIALIESGLGVLNLQSIASSSNRLRALIFGADDLAADIGAVRTTDNSEVLVARSLVVLAAKAYGLQALDLVQINYNDSQLLERECKSGLILGYTGKQIIHPNQIEICHRTFAPSEERLQWAKKMVSEADRHEKEGKGAFSVDGLMIDMPTIKNARYVLARAKACGITV